MVPRFHWNVTCLLAIVSIGSIERSGPVAFDSEALQRAGIARPDTSDTMRTRLSRA